MITREQLIQAKNAAEKTLVFLDTLESKMKKVDKGFDSNRYKHFRKLMNDFLKCNLSDSAIINDFH